MAQPSDPSRVDWDNVNAILKDSFFAHVSFTDKGGLLHCIPMIAPVLQFPEDPEPYLYLHGHPSSPLIQMVTGSAHTTLERESNLIVAITATKVDGINLSSAPNGHSFNYRTVSINGSCSLGPTDLLRKLAVMRAVTNHIVPGRWDDVNPVSREILSLVAIVRVRVDTARVRIRQGGPNIQKRDPEIGGPEKPGGVWTGVIPVWEQLGEPVESGKTPATVIPPSLNKFLAERNNASRRYAMENAVKQRTT
ncbi:hypothetical protein PV08_09825 [Exophiala spinifera]|uniref:Flavin-nucleotide-binding protein n=1 Tax=Exophiala spinifera TaxID=91928 RepID=A0A0D2B0Z2_9EURO|nr:uncharacterized protein PV08_09825 [Exophiala spinifera]KIW12548.1 hypothetical protein PV08_09825 [Exophiala spinifera]